MNRLVDLHATRAISLAATLCLLAPSVVSAQVPLSGTSSVATVPTPALGQQVIQQARSAMASRDYATAVNHYRNVASMAAKVPQLRPEVASLQVDLRIAGIDAELLSTSLPPATPASLDSLQRLPDVVDASPIGMQESFTANTSQPVTRKAEALKLLAIGRAALDRSAAFIQYQVEIAANTAVGAYNGNR